MFFLKGVIMVKRVDTVLTRSPFLECAKQKHEDDFPAQENILYLYRCRDDYEENKEYYHWDDIDDINYQILEHVQRSLRCKHV